MRTKLGIFLRKLRIDRNELLKDMADNLDLSSSYLSAIELGKRAIPKEFYSIFVNNYDLSISQQYELKRSITLSRKELIVNLANLRNERDKELAINFAYNFERLSSEEKNILEHLFNK